MSTTWDYDQTRWWTDAAGQEWICIPWDQASDITVPDQLRRVADQWEAENEREAGA